MREPVGDRRDLHETDAMKSRTRPPLNLVDLESDVPSPGGLDAASMSIPDEVINVPEPQHTVAPAPPPPSMSERRRRRLAEEARIAEEARGTDDQAVDDRVATSSYGDAPSPAAQPMMAQADSATPPATYQAPSAPALAHTDKPEPVAGRQAYLIGGIAAALWIAGIASWFAFEAGAGTAEVDPVRLAVYALLALAPAGLAIMLAHAVRQGAGLAQETRRARFLADAMVAPTALAAGQAGQLVTALRTDIDLAAVAAERARNDMALLREALAGETVRLNEAAETAARTARRLTEQLGQERDAMQALGVHLDGQATGVIDAVERQSRMVADASDLAQTQLREAEAALAARAADLAAAAGEAQDAARLAADDLARQTLRLENAGTGVAEQIHSVEQGLGQQRAALVTAAFELRTDQEDFSAQVESQRAQLAEQLSSARAASGDLGDLSTRSTDAIREVVEAAGDQFRALIEMSAREADGFDAATKTALDRFESLAVEARDALVEETRRALAAMQATAEEARQAADEAAGQAQLRADRLGEALFEAAQKADFAADTRIEGARRIVTETASLVDEVGERAVEKLEATIARMAAALETVDATMTDMDARAARMPDEARERMNEVRATVEDGLNALAEASRKAAQDTEALDAGFQERVRRNYDMLTEAVRLMGVVSGDGSSAQRRRETSPASEAVEPRRAAPTVQAVPAPTPSPVQPQPEEASKGFGLRGRLRLAPTKDNDRPVGVPPWPAERSEVLDWHELAGTHPEDPVAEAPLDLVRPVSAADADALADRITAAIRRMGVDPNALLPRSRVEEAAVAFDDRDPDRARQIVRRVAPAAVRSVSRRVMSDPELKADAERYVRGFSEGLTDGGSGDGEPPLSKLASDAGRAFLLLDAAIGDLA